MAAPSKPGPKVGMMPIRAVSVWSAARKGDTVSLASLLSQGASVNEENPVRACFLRSLSPPAPLCYLVWSL